MDSSVEEQGKVISEYKGQKETNAVTDYEFKKLATAELASQSKESTYVPSDVTLQKRSEKNDPKKEIDLHAKVRK